MDWFEDLKSHIWVLPRGMERDGLAAKNPMTWKSRYGSVVITAYDCVSADGINEKNLAVHMLYLSESSAGARDEKVPGLCMSMWPQYYLDNFATVAEAVASLEKSPYQLIMAVEPMSKAPTAIHLALNDQSGDSAVLECIGGKIKVYHDRKYTVMTNEPAFDKQLENLKRYRGFGGVEPLPGTAEPDDRFVRGAYYLARLPKPQTDRAAVAELMSVMRNVSTPFGVSEPGRPNVSATIWRTVTDLTHGVLYYDSVDSPQIFWIDTKSLNFDAGQPVRKLALTPDSDLSGDVSAKFARAEMFSFLKPN